MSYPENFNYKIIIAYDGTAYPGWQIQPHALSIQQIIQDKFAIFVRHPITLIGSGRTDAGVHAHGQVAHFKTAKELNVYRTFASANGLLPPDIRICNIEQVPLDFHAQYSVRSKVYHYHFTMDRFENPFKRNYSYHLPFKIDVDRLALAAQEFVGEHDFTSFANAAQEGTAARNPIRHLSRLDVMVEGNAVRLEFEANGFLYKMVRNITGTLLEVAAGERELADIKKILLAKDRRLAGRAAPAHGLFLAHVNYPKNGSWRR